MKGIVAAVVVAPQKCSVGEKRSQTRILVAGQASAPSFQNLLYFALPMIQNLMLVADQTQGLIV